MKCPHPITIPDPTGTKNTIRVPVPCGKCGACRHNYRSTWTFRLREELKDSRTAYFITLTYNEEHVPINRFTGEPQLNKEDLQKFIKRLRKKNDTVDNNTDNPFLETHKMGSIRYFQIGEYGTTTNRPHYHGIYFNIHPQLIHFIDDLWKLGQIQVGDVNPKSIAYVTKYHVNPQRYFDHKTDEFATMSRNPGIGASYIKRNKKWHRENWNWYIINDGLKQQMPKYYKDKIFTESERRARFLMEKCSIPKRYNQEIKRLSKIHIGDPHAYYYERVGNKALSVRRKSHNNDIL